MQVMPHRRLVLRERGGAGSTSKLFRVLPYVLCFCATVCALCLAAVTQLGPVGVAFPRHSRDDATLSALPCMPSLWLGKPCVGVAAVRDPAVVEARLARLQHQVLDLRLPANQPTKRDCEPCCTLAATQSALGAVCSVCRASEPAGVGLAADGPAGLRRFLCSGGWIACCRRPWCRAPGAACCDSPRPANRAQPSSNVNACQQQAPATDTEVARAHEAHAAVVGRAVVDRDPCAGDVLRERPGQISVWLP